MTATSGAAPPLPEAPAAPAEPAVLVEPPLPPEPAVPPPTPPAEEPAPPPPELEPDAPAELPPVAWPATFVGEPLVGAWPALPPLVVPPPAPAVSSGEVGPGAESPQPTAAAPQVRSASTNERGGVTLGIRGAASKFFTLRGRRRDRGFFQLRARPPSGSRPPAEYPARSYRTNSRPPGTRGVARRRCAPLGAAATSRSPVG